MYCLSGKGLKGIMVIAIIGIVTSVLPLFMFGTSYFSVTGGCITLLFATEAALTFYMRKTRK